jgi:hypothetical protein
MDAAIRFLLYAAKREDKWFPWIFKDCDERTGYSENRILYQAAFLSSGQSKISRRAIDCEMG